MIAHLVGIPHHVLDNSVILDVQGVGYQVFVSTKTAATLQQDPTATVSLWIETQLRQESLSLYGFLTLVEQEWFRLLTTVQGVGSKMALSLLSCLEPDALLQAILEQDGARLTQADGVGPKLATRICHELKTKATKMPQANQVIMQALSSSQGSVWQEATSALTNLGYGPVEIRQVLETLRTEQGDDVQLDHVIRQGLRYLSQGAVA